MLKLEDYKDLENKKVLLRADLDVPFSNGRIGDQTRLLAGLSTIQFLLEKKAQVIIVGHLGRPSGWDQNLSLKIVALWYAEKLNGETRETVVGDFKGWQILPGLTLLENLRFYKEEKENDPQFAQRLASIAEIYVNDAFASSHRDHASIVGVARLLPHIAGFELQKEIENLSKVLKNPERPMTVVIGGAKIETKLPVVSKMHTIADYVLIGGKIAEETKTLIHLEHEKTQGNKAVLLIADRIPDSTDITEESVSNFIQIIAKSKTIVWNGPMGFLEKGKTRSSIEIAQAIINSNSYSIVGGGDTIAFLNKKRLLDKFSFVSMGGGAMLELLAGEKLPGLVALSS